MYDTFVGNVIKHSLPKGMTLLDYKFDMGANWPCDSTLEMTLLVRLNDLENDNSTVTKESLLPVKNLKGNVDIVKVVYNDPATVVFWTDGTKTVVKCKENDEFSKENGLALCIAKKALGNKGNFNNVFRKWCKEENEND